MGVLVSNWEGEGVGREGWRKVILGGGLGKTVGLGWVTVNAHLRPVKPLWWEERVKCCEKEIREADRRDEEAESR